MAPPLTSGNPVLMAYVRPDGYPRLSFRGSTQVWSDAALAVWVRDPQGGLLSALDANDRVTFWYRRLPDPVAHVSVSSGRARESRTMNKPGRGFTATLPSPNSALTPRGAASPSSSSLNASRDEPGGTRCAWSDQQTELSQAGVAIEDLKIGTWESA